MATRSLGTLTLDLIAKIGGFEQGLSKADRASKKTFKNIERNVNTAAKAVAGFGVAAAGSLVALTVDTINTAREIKNLSMVANASVTDFQRIAYAAQRYGVEQDKVADILKDTTDKVGDFLQTGGGPLADFFENIAPQVGVTADQFRRLSGPEALQLYVDSLEKANVSQNELTFFLEAIASDATLLLPLLRNNATELNKLGDEADQFGNVLSEIEIQRLEEARQAVDILSSRFTGLKNEVVIAVLPAVEDLIQLLSDPETVKAMTTLANAVVTAFTKATEAIKTTIEVTQFISEDIAAAINGPSSDDIARLEAYRVELQKLVDADFGIFARGNAPIKFAFDSEEDLRQQLAEINQQIDDYYNNPGNLPAVPVATQAAPELDLGSFENDRPLAPLPPSEVERAIEALEMQVELLGKSNTEVELAQLRAMGATDAQIELARAALDTVAVFETEAEAAKALQESIAEINNQAEAIRQQLLTEEEAIEESYEKRRDIILKATELTEMERQDLLGRLQKQHQEEVDEFIKNSTKDRNTDIADSYSVLLDIVSQYYDGMQGEQAAYARAAIALGQALLDADKREALQEIVANTSAAAMKAYNALASIPYVGPVLGAAAAAGIYVAGGAAAAKVTGLAHDGIDSVPEDGTWLLERGERVTTAETSAKLDATLEEIKKNQNDMQGKERSTKIINLWDTQQIGDYIGTQPGEEAVMNVVRKNPDVVRAISQGV